MTGGFVHLTRTKADDVRQIPINDDLVALCRRVRARGELESEKELQEMLGYKTMAATMRLAHFSQEHKQRAINRLNGLTASVQTSMGVGIGERAWLRGYMSCFAYLCAMLVFPVGWQKK